MAEESERRLTDVETELYHRHIILRELGEAGQIRLLQGRVLIVGLGGLGSSALYYLAACGIGEIGIVDDERVEMSNLQRQILHGLGDLGKEKSLSARESIERMRGDVRLKTYTLRVSAENAEEIISPYDFVIDATDNFESKFLINDVCIRLGKAFSHAGITEMFGQTMTVVPGMGPCFRCVFEDLPPPGVVKNTAEVGILGTVPGLMGVIQATEAIKYLLQRGSLLVGRLLTWDAFDMVFREIRLPDEKRCGICRAATQPRQEGR